MPIKKCLNTEGIKGLFSKEDETFILEANDKYIKEGQSEIEAANNAIRDYHKQLSDELNDLKVKVGQTKHKYVREETKAQEKEIEDRYAKEIQSLEQPEANKNVKELSKDEYIESEIEALKSSEDNYYHPSLDKVYREALSKQYDALQGKTKAVPAKVGTVSDLLNSVAMYNRLNRGEKKSEVGRKLLNRITDDASEIGHTIRFIKKGKIQLLNEKGRQVYNEARVRTKDAIEREKAEKAKLKRALNNTPQSIEHQVAMDIANGVRFNLDEFVRLTGVQPKELNRLLFDNKGQSLEFYGTRLEEHGGVIPAGMDDVDIANEVAGIIEANYSGNNAKENAKKYALEVYEKEMNGGMTDAEVARMMEETGTTEKEVAVLANVSNNNTEEELVDNVNNLETAKDDKQQIETATEIVASGITEKTDNPFDDSFNEEEGYEKNTIITDEGITGKDVSTGTFKEGEEPFQKLKTIEDESESIIKGESEFKRLSPAEEYGRIKGGRRNVEASIVLSRVQKASGGYKKGFTELSEVKNDEESALEKYAKEKGIWHKNVSKEFGEPHANGFEQDVYLEGNNVVKINNGLANENWTELFDRISIHNYLFPETAYTVEGFGKTKNGDFVVILKQPLIIGKMPRFSEVKSELKNRGYEILNEGDTDNVADFVFRNKQNGTIISDVHGENVIKGENGKLYFIDPLVSADTMEAGYGGNRKIEAGTVAYKGNAENIKTVVDRIQKVLPKVKVVYDETLNAKGKWSPKTNTLSVNPYYATKDTAIHEAGHILIDAMGGTNNRVIKAAIKQLEGTPLWKETAKAYPLSQDYTIDDLGKEVLAEAIGREGAGIFDTVSEQSKFKTYLNYIFDWLKRNLGLEKNIAKNLAKQIIGGIGTKKLSGTTGKEQSQKPKELEYAEGQLRNAEKELKASKTAFDTKRKELGKEINNDQEDLFGERKSTEGAGLFDERVDMSAYEGVITPFKQRYDLAVKEFTKWQNKVKELEGKEDSQTSLFQKNKKTEIEELQNDLNAIEEQLDIEEDEDNINELESARDVILGKIEALKDEGTAYVERDNLINGLDIEKATLPELIDAYIALEKQAVVLTEQTGEKHYADKQKLKDIKEKIGYILNNSRIEDLQKKWGKQIADMANKKDLTGLNVWTKAMGHISEAFPAIQGLYNEFNQASLDKEKETYSRKTELDKKAKAVIKEANKKLGVKDWAKGLFTSNSAKYFNYLEENGKLRTNTSGLSKAQIEYLEMVRELVKEKNELAGKTTNDLELIKTDKGFQEAFKDDGFMAAVSLYLGGGENVDTPVTYTLNGKTQTVPYKDAQKAILDYSKGGLKEKVISVGKLLSISYKAKKGAHRSDRNINYNGILTSKFDQPYDKAVGFSKDYHNATMQLIDDIAHVKHFNKLVPLANAVELFYQKTGVEQEMQFGHVLEFMRNWKNEQIYQKTVELDPTIDAVASFLRKMTSLTVMSFAVPANIMNVAIGNYNSIRKEGWVTWAKGQKELFAGDKHRAGFGFVGKKANDINNKYQIVKSDLDSNPKNHIGKWFDQLAFAGTRFGEYQIQLSIALGLMKDAGMLDSFTYNKKGELVLKDGINEKEFDKKINEIKDKVSDIQGKYAQKDRRNFARYELGKAAAQFKNWIPDWTKERFGAEYIDSKGNLHRGSWRLLSSNAIKEMKSDMATHGKWLGLFKGDSLGSKNFRSNLNGLLFLSALYVLKNSGDDDDKKKRETLSLENAMEQVLFVYDPSQAKYLLKSPIASWGIIDKFLTVVEDIIDGKTEKAGKTAKKLIPYNKVYDDVNYLMGNDKK